MHFFCVPILSFYFGPIPILSFPNKTILRPANLTTNLTAHSQHHPLSYMARHLALIRIMKSPEMNPRPLVSKLFGGFFFRPVPCDAENTGKRLQYFLTVFSIFLKWRRFLSYLLLAQYFRFHSNSENVAPFVLPPLNPVRR